MNQQQTTYERTREQAADPTEEQLVAEIETTRTRMSGTIDEIGYRLSPQVIAGQARDQLREATVGRVERVAQDAGYTAQQTGNTIMATVRENPVPAALAALGIGWLAMRLRDQQSSQQRRDYRHPVAYRDIRDEDHAAGVRQAYPAGDGGDSGPGIGDRAGEIGDQAQQAWQDVQHQAQGQARTLQRQFDRTLDENPLALGALAVGVGAAVALAIPETEREREIMGEHRDRLIAEAERAASGALADVEQEATRALRQGEDQVRQTGQSMRQEAHQQRSG